jgi:peptide/nickel transport system permease protein
MNATIGRLLLQRFSLALLTLLMVSVVVFAITNLLPGDAAEESLGQAATPQAVAALRAQFGLDQPAPQRYVHWLVNMAGGDAGTSLVSGKPVGDLIADRLPSSLVLAGVTAAVSVPVALALGILSAMLRGSLFDRAVNIGAVALVSVPEFLVATLAVLLFAVKLRWLSALSHTADIASFGEFVRAYAMPVFTLCCVIVAQMARMTRAALLDQLDAPYVEMARLKGAGPVRAVLVHALPNTVGPIANAVALSLSYLLGGVLIVETVFNYPGIANLMIDAVTTRDIPLVQACAMIFCSAYLLLVMLADTCAIVANPRLRKQ